jgi:hypothetical protein
MGGGPIRNSAGVPSEVGVSNTPLARQLRGLRQVQPLPPVAKPIQPIRPVPAGGPFTHGIGNRKTLNMPGAPTLPNNPLADAAWRRGVYGPKQKIWKLRSSFVVDTQLRPLGWRESVHSLQ